MDFFENVAKQASQITMYDVKSYYNQAKNMVLNVPEMEAKVREATNEDAWGASSTLMQEIAAGTHNFQHFNEIMPTIYSRFMEKEAREWRQIYKALTLLEYLIKHGSERVIDDARAHVSTIKMLRNFHYIDEKGKDQGINVRNRANELASLLSDVDKIRSERRKAKANRNKYQGVEGGMFNTASGSRYGGFGSDSVGGGGGGGGSGGGAGGSSSGGWGRDEDDYGRRASPSNFRDTSSRVEYDEYEGADDFERQPARTSSANAGRGSSSTSASRPPRTSPAPPKPPKAEPPKPKKEVNLFDFDDDPAAPAAAAAPGAAAAPVDAFGDDDFDDFQQAPGAPAAAPPAAGGNTNLFALLESNKSSSTHSHGAPPPSFATPAAAPTAAPPSYGMGMGMAQPQRPAATSPAAAPTPAAPAPKKTGSAFDDLFTASLGSAPVAKAASPSGGKTIAQMEKEKAQNQLWGSTPTATASAPAAAPAAASTNKLASQFDDLLL